MLFHSVQFAVFFLLAFLGHWLLVGHRRTHLFFLAAMSVWFYAAWNAYYVALIVVSTVIDFVAAERIHASRSSRARKAWLLASLVGNLGMLGTFKYYDFFVTSVLDLTTWIGLPLSLPTLRLLLPVGISFYTFQSLSYTIDVYRGKLQPVRSFLDLFVFVIFFPQLVAGPIVRASELLPQLSRPRRLTREDVGIGTYRIVRGLVRKVVLADTLGRILVDPTFLDHEAASGVVLLLAVYGFAFQIYGDFAGYSDVAIGAARLMGYRFPENFRSPFRSTSFRDIFVRWHITLGTWLRDYVFQPLGGYRRGRTRGYFNLVVTMFLAGLWHGAAWNFVVFGLYCGVMMRFDPLRKHREPSWLRVWFWRVVFFQLFAFAFLLFRSDSLALATSFTGRLVSGLASTTVLDQVVRVVQDPAMRGALVALVFVGSTQLVTDEAKARLELWIGRRSLLVHAGMAAVGLGLVIALYSSQSPFIYFQF